MRSWPPNIQSQYVIFLFLFLLAGLAPSPRAYAQTTSTVTINDSTTIGSNARPGLNLGQPSGSYPFFKNYLAFGNPGFEPMIDQQIYQFQAPQDTSSPTSFRWNVNNTRYESYDANQWAGATFTVVQGSYASGTSDPALGCTGTIQSSTNESSAGPIFVVNAATNQGSSGCAGNLGVPGQVIIVSTNNNMSNVFPTPSSIWQAGSNGLLAPPTLSGGATVSSETTDLCATCGTQSLLFTVPAGGSATLSTGNLLNTASEKTVVLNGAYTISFWAKSNAAALPKVTITATPRAGSSCTQTYSGSTSPAITSTWTQFNVTCNFTESASSGGPYPFFVTFTVAPASSAATSLEFDNWSITSNEDTNPTAYSDAYVNALRSWCQNTSNTTGPACTLRYGPSPDSEIMSNWVKPQFQHRPSIEQFSAISTAYSTDKTNINDFLNLCEYVGATPVVIFPVTMTTSDVANLVDFLEGSTSTPYGEIRASLGQATPWVGASGSPFSTIYLEFGNENWNGGFLGHTLGYNVTSPNVYYDYGTRAGVVFAAARARQAAEGYSQTATKWVVNLQTASPGNASYALNYAHGDVGEINGYTALNINSTSTSGCLTSGSTNATCPLYGPTLTEPYSNTHDPNSTSGFAQSITAITGTSACGPSGTAPCQVMVYEENTGPNASTAGPFTQAVSDSFVQAGFQGVVAADQMGENDTAGVISQNEYQALQYYFGEGGVNVHMWGAMIDAGGDCSNYNSSSFGGSYCPRPQMLGAQVYNWCKIGPMVQTSWTSNPTYNLAANNNGVNAISGVPVLRSYAFAQGNQRCMVIVNADVYSSHNVTFTGTNAPSSGVTTYQFAPSALSVANEMSALATTSTLETPMSDVTTPGVSVASGYSLPPDSVTAFMWETNGSTSTQTAATPTFSPAAGTYSSAQTVAISSPTSGATIYYTTNGTTPTTSSTKYSGAIAVSATETINAIAVASGYTNSAVSTAAYTITTANPAAATPVLSLASGTYTGSQNVTITDATSGVTIYYTTNGSTPTTSSTVYSGAITVSSTETLEAIAVETGYTNSAVATAPYTISTSAASTNIFNIANFANATSELSFNGNTQLDGAKLQLTNGGLSENSSAWYSTPVNVNSFTTNFTFQETNAVADGFTFTIQSDSPTALGSGGAGLGFDNLQLSAGIKFDLDAIGSIPESTGLYTDGAVPFTTTGSINLGPSGINLASGDVMSVQLVYNGTTLTMTLTDTVTKQVFTQSWTVNIPSAVGTNTAYVGFTGASGGKGADQEILTWSYSDSSSSSTSPVLPTPTFSVAAGTYAAAQTVSIADATAGTTIYYTTDGSTPTTSSTVYSGPVNVASTETLEAIAVETGYTNSPAAVAAYTISGGCYLCVAATPTFGVPAGTYSSTQTVSISDATKGATIYYTTNGSTPTTSSSKYSDPITVSATETLEAIAVASGYTNSPAATASYAIFLGQPGTTSNEVINITDFANSSAQLSMNGNATLDGAKLQLTNGGLSEDSSAWYSEPVSVNSFTTDITFQVTDAVADGFTFTVQGVGPHALGSGGAGLGFSNLQSSVGLKLYLHAIGSIPESTGLYKDGAAPYVSTGSVNLAPSGINLRSGDAMTLHLVYNGTTLTMTLTDTVTKASFTDTFTVNIPSIVGGNTAYVGFTGASGGAGADQEILGWSYSN